ncbi:hypothetical protein ACFWAY_48430 [Rhodococcus sp. NPDC059968]|uniref:hypothetical protein n=1 Tax=Rhodococcus sp. NPDC059968 TaxID=3347017 RepID=UPI003670307C
MVAATRKHIRSVEVEIYPGIGHDLLSANRNRRSHASSTSLKATIQSEPEARGIGRRRGQPTRLRRLTGKVYRPPASQAWDSREPSGGREWLLRQLFSVTRKSPGGRPPQAHYRMVTFDVDRQGRMSDHATYAAADLLMSPTPWSQSSPWRNGVRGG